MIRLHAVFATILLPEASVGEPSFPLRALGFEIDLEVSLRVSVLEIEGTDARMVAGFESFAGALVSFIVFILESCNHFSILLIRVMRLIFIRCFLCLRKRAEVVQH